MNKPALVTALLLSLPVFGAHVVPTPNATPVLRITNNSGFVPPEHTKSETCEIYENGIVITRTYGAPIRAKFVEKKDSILSGEVRQLVLEASAEALENGEELPCDGPSTNVEAFRDGQPITLFMSRGCGTPMQTRAGVASKILRRIIKAGCPEGWAP